MSRVQIATQSWGVLQDHQGTGLSGQTVAITTLAAVAQPTYTTATGSVAASLVTDSNGRIAGWIEEGTYLISYSSGGATVSYRVEAPAGSIKPSAVVDAFLGPQFQFVAEKNGVDTNDGLSWGSPKKEIGAAVTALGQGGVIYVAPGSYRPSATIALDGHQIIGPGLGTGQGVSALAVVQHGFNGNLFNFTKGGSLSGLYLQQQGDFTGAALAATGTGSPRVGGIYVRDVTITGATHGFYRDVDFDGSADSTAGGPGIRQVYFVNVQMFGCKTAGETCRLNRVIHAHFTGCEVVQAPETSVTQGVKILHAESEDITWAGKVLGDWSTAAQGGGITFFGRITGTITCAASTTNNIFVGAFDGTFTNNGAASNKRTP